MLKIPVQNNYEIAYKEAVTELRNKDLNDVCIKSGAAIDGAASKNILLPFLNNIIDISYPGFEFKYKNKDDKIDLWLQILILHYLNNAKGTGFTGKEITYKEISGGMAYYTAFKRRALDPIFKKFGSDLNRFILSAEKVGGVRTDTGDYSVNFHVLPMIKISYNIWAADEDFPAEANILFDSSITDYFTSEDITVLCNIITIMIVKNN